MVYTLFQFQTKYKTLDDHIQTVEKVDAQLNDQLAAAHKFIQEDCAFQYARISNGNTRLLQLIGIDKEKSKNYHEVFEGMQGISQHWSDVHDNVAAYFWKHIADNELELGKTNDKLVDLDQKAYKAATSTSEIASVCKPAKTDNKDFIIGTPQP